VLATSIGRLARSVFEIFVIVKKTIDVGDNFSTSRSRWRRHLDMNESLRSNGLSVFELSATDAGR